MWLSLEDETGLEWSIVCLPETEGFLGRWTFSATIRNVPGRTGWGGHPCLLLLLQTEVLGTTQEGGNGGLRRMNTLTSPTLRDTR